MHDGSYTYTKVIEGHEVVVFVMDLERSSMEGRRCGNCKKDSIGRIEHNDIDHSGLQAHEEFLARMKDGQEKYRDMEKRLLSSTILKKEPLLVSHSLIEAFEQGDGDYIANRLSPKMKELAIKRIQRDWWPELDAEEIAAQGEWRIPVFWGGFEEDVALYDLETFEKFFGRGACPILAEALALKTGGNIKTWGYTDKHGWGGHAALRVNEELVIDAFGIHPSNETYEHFDQLAARRERNEVAEEVVTVKEFQKEAFGGLDLRLWWKLNGKLEREIAGIYADFLLEGTRQSNPELFDSEGKLLVS